MFYRLFADFPVAPCCPFPPRWILFVLNNLSQEFRSYPAYVFSVVVPSLLCLVLRGGLALVISIFLCAWVLFCIHSACIGIEVSVTLRVIVWAL